MPRAEAPTHAPGSQRVPDVTVPNDGAHAISPVVLEPLELAGSHPAPPGAAQREYITGWRLYALSFGYEIFPGTCVVR
jgi:hypothetical protein